ncbi:hypothetical protein EVAR_94545_1 [Eumeta japonica]|uniref:Uncharacterized protein n=1 Tax=Eumeta variegata TaxID=151549 RepID=A0A4C1UW47_EUMVA|nr:hypothetical protein EVAR_94545_1 [Eumeta japonica]
MQPSPDSHGREAMEGSLNVNKKLSIGQRDELQGVLFIPYFQNRRFDNVFKQSEIFANLDLTSGYWQKVISEDRSKIAFITLSGIFELNVVLNELWTSQANFQKKKMMDTVLAGINYRNAIVYVDDVRGAADKSAA